MSARVRSMIACALLALGCGGGGPIAAPLRYDAVAATREETFRAAPPAYAGDGLEVGWRLEQRSLANGLRVAIVPRRAAPIVAVRLAFARGAADDASLDPDVMAFLAAAMVLGTRGGERAWDDRFAAVGASIGDRADADATSFHFVTQASHLSAAMGALAEMTLAPAFDDAAIAHLRDRWRDTYAARTYFPLDNSALRSVFGAAHPYGRALTRKDAAKLEALDVSALAARHRALVHPAQAMLIVVGDVNVDDVMADAERAFGAWRRDDAPIAVGHPEITIGRANPVIHVAGGMTQSLVSIAAAGPRPTSADDWTAMLAAALLLGGMRSSEIHADLRESQGLAYVFGARVDAHREGSCFFMRGGFRPEDVPASLKRMLQAIAALRASPLPDAEVAKARAKLVANWREATSSTPALALVLETAAREHMPLEEVVSFPARASAVRAADIQRVARVYLADSRLHAVIGGKVDARALADAGFLDVEQRTTEGQLRIEGQ